MSAFGGIGVSNASLNRSPVIAILGGTGELGMALARRWLAAEYPVVIGSRSEERALAAARQLGVCARGASTKEAARLGEIVVLAVPYASHNDTLLEVLDVIDGKILVDAVVPLVPPRVSVAQLPPDGCAAIVAQKIVGSRARVASAFHNVGAAKLRAEGPIDCDVLVFSDDKEARGVVMKLADAAGARGLDGGALANSVAAEAMTSVLIGLNRLFRVSGAGIRITGLPTDAR